MSGPAEFVAAARALRGAKWRHRGRKPWAVDCVGLLVLAGQKAGLAGGDDEALYGREPWEDRLRQGCRRRWGEPIEVSAAQPGDIVIFRFGQAEPSHIGLIGDHPQGGLTLIHAHNLRGVCECSLRGRYLAAVVEVFRTRFV